MQKNTNRHAELQLGTLTITEDQGRTIWGVVKGSCMRRLEVFGLNKVEPSVYTET